MLEYTLSALHRTGAGGRSREGTSAEVVFVLEGWRRLAAAVVFIDVDDDADADAEEAEKEETKAASFAPPSFIPFASAATRRSGRGACHWRVGFLATNGGKY